MNTQREVFKRLFKEEKTELETHKIDLGLVDKLESKYKSLGKSDVGNYLSQVNKIVSNLKGAIEKTGDLKDEVKKAVNGYGSMGDTDNKKLAERLFNDVNSDFEELVFIYQKLKSI
tara:strand:+ start:2443 stop:2790 length:348 start_codon:yes stop_codon:yes gene_type:complete